MNKDGTRRGGARRGSGKKPKSQVDMSVVNKIKVTASELKSMPDDIETFSNPDFKKIYASIYKFVKDHNAIDKTPPELLTLFAQSYARWMEAEKRIDSEGLTAKHDNGATGKSPLVNISDMYSKQAQSCWFLVWSIIKETAEPITEDDDMEELLDS